MNSLPLRRVMFLALAFAASCAFSQAPTPTASASKTASKPESVLVNTPLSAVTFIKKISDSEYMAQISVRVANDNKMAVVYRPRLSLIKKDGMKDLMVGAVSIRLNSAPSEVISPPNNEIVSLPLLSGERKIEPAMKDNFEIQIALRCKTSDPENCWEMDEKDLPKKASLRFSFLSSNSATAMEIRVRAGEPVKSSDDLGFNDPIIKAMVNDEKITQSGLFFEQAMIKKALADELFLRGDKSVAAKKYDEAKKIASLVQKYSNIDAKDKSTTNLLIAEIDYRRTLLKGGLDFWGGYRSRTPAIPIRHLAALEDLFGEFEHALNQIDSFSTSVVTADQELLKAKAALQELNGKLAAYLVDRDKSVISQQRERRSINDTWANISSVEAQQRRIHARTEQLAAQQASLSARASALLTQAVAKSAGIDPAILDNIKSGNVRSIVESYVQNQVGNPNSELMQNFAALSEESNKMVDLYGQIRESGARINELKSDFETAAMAVQKPTAESISKLGASIWAKLPEAEKARIADLIKNKVSTIEWVRSSEEALRALGRSTNLLQQKLAEVLLKAALPTAEIRMLMHTALLRIQDLDGQGRNELKGLIDSVLVELSATGAPSSRLASLTNAVASSFPEQFVARLPPAAKQLLIAEFRVSSEAQLVSRLKVTGLSSFKISSDGLDQIYFDGLSTLQRVAVSKAAILSSVSLVGQGDKIITDAERFFDSVSVSVDSGVKVVLQMVPIDLLASKLQAESGNAAKSLPAVLQASLAPQDFESIQEKAYSTMVGYANVESMVAAIPPPEATSGRSENIQGVEDDLGIPQGGEPDPATNQAMALALDAAFPGAGTALQLVQAFGSMDANRKLNERLSQESARLMAKKVELIERQTNTYYDELLTQKDQIKSEALAEASRQQVIQYQQSMQKYIESRNTDDAKIGLRRGWTFYLAERMREEFDQFDRSFALWSRGENSRGAVEQEIKNDPQNVRYALDSDIQLYDWLTRTGESSRSDPDTLRVHWARMLRLAKDLCQKRGCKPGDGMLGQIASTREISILNELLSARDLARFREWQKNPVSTFRAEFSILPFHNILPSRLENVRLIELRASVQAESGAWTTVDQVAIRHQGTSYIPRIKRDTAGPTSLSLEMESMFPRISNSFNAASEFDLEALRTRYDAYFTGSNLPSARIFEGYGMYATYELMIEPTIGNTAAKDFVVRFAYHYNDSYMVVNEAQFMQRILGRGTNLVSEAVTVGVQETRGNCSRMDKLPPRTLSNISLETRWFFLPRDNKYLDALNKEQLEALDELNSCNTISLRPLCRTKAEIESLVDGSLRTKDGRAAARDLNLVKPDASEMELRQAMVSRASTLALGLNCYKM